MNQDQEGDQNTAKTIESLSEEELLAIFSYLPANNLKTASLVSKRQEFFLCCFPWNFS